MSFYDELKCKLQRLFKMSPFCMNRTRARSCERHLSIVLSMAICSRLSHTSIRRYFRWSTSYTFAQ